MSLDPMFEPKEDDLEVEVEKDDEEKEELLKDE